MHLAPPIPAWITRLEERGKSAHTCAAYGRAVNHFAAWYAAAYEDEFAPSLVLPRDVQTWKAHQQTTEQAAPATINQRLVALSAFFKWAITENLAAHDPTAEVSSLSLPELRPKALSGSALRRLIRAAQENSVRDYALLELMAGTGLRVSEALALKVGDVHLGERSGKVIVRLGKRASYREVLLSASVRLALTAYLESLPNRAELAPDAPLWSGQRGPLADSSAVNRLLSQYEHATRADVPLTPHTLRHTFAIRYLEANPGDLRGLAAALGHHSLNTVMIYTQPSAQAMQERMEKLEVAF